MESALLIDKILNKNGNSPLYLEATLCVSYHTSNNLSDKAAGWADNQSTRLVFAVAPSITIEGALGCAPIQSYAVRAGSFKPTSA